MKSTPVLIDLTPSNLESLPCCGVRNPAHEGRRLKNCWLQTHFKKGLRAMCVLTPDNRPCGYIEYLPGEYAWRGVEAGGYMFIHCVWTYFRQYQRKGLARRLVEAAVQDAKKARMNGVAVLARSSPWLAGSSLFGKAGFEVVATAPPDYELLVRKLKSSAPEPSFKDGWESKLKKYQAGLTIIRSNQCPHVAKFATDIARIAEEEYGLKPKFVELRSYREAQAAPTPYAVFSVILDGQLLADHQISGTRFRNIMRKLRGS